MSLWFQIYTFHAQFGDRYLEYSIKHHPGMDAWGLIDYKSTLVQVMAWCHQVTSHYLNECWPRSLTPYGITRLQWVKEYGILESAWLLDCPSIYWFELHHVVCQSIQLSSNESHLVKQDWDLRVHPRSRSLIEFKCQDGSWHISWENMSRFWVIHSLPTQPLW